MSDRSSDHAPATLPASAQAGASTAATAVAAGGARDVESLVQQMLATPLRSPPPVAAVGGAAGQEEAAAAAEDAESDSLALPLSLCYRLTVLVQRAPTAAEGARRAGRMWSAGGASLISQCVAGLDHGTEAGHELAYLFVRLLALLAWAAPPAAVAMLQINGTAADRSNAVVVADNDDGAATLMQLLTGLMRLSSAPLMLRELVDLMAALLCVSEFQLLSPPHSDALAAAAALSARSLFMHAFLDRSQGRSVLLLLKHVAHPLLSEASRTTLLRVLLALASAPVTEPTVSEDASTGYRTPPTQPAALARRVFDSQRDRWSEATLPPLQSLSANDSEPRVDNEAQRRMQLRLIKQLRAVLLVTAPALPAAAPTGPVAATSSFGLQRPSSQPSRLHPQPQSHPAALHSGGAVLSSRAAARLTAAAASSPDDHSGSHFISAVSSGAAANRFPTHSFQWSAPVDPFAPSQPSAGGSLYPTLSSSVHAVHR